MRNITISDLDAGQRLDKYLKKYLSGASSGFIYKMLRKKNILLNDRKASGSEKLNENDMITLYMSDATIDKFSTGPRDVLNGVKVRKGDYNAAIVYGGYSIDILYEDEHIAFLNKPAGLLSQKAQKDDISLVEIFESYVNITADTVSSVQRPGICNRLDRNTSGVVACGKTLKGLSALNEVIRERSVRKFYRCVVCGHPKDHMRLCGYLIKDDKTNKVKYYSNRQGSDASYIETVYDTVKRYKDASLLEVELITGKTHQIRAHLASCGNPLAGDVKYGAMRDMQLKHYLLHSYKLCFGKCEGVLAGVSNMVIKAPIPPEFDRYTDRIR